MNIAQQDRIAEREHACPRCGAAPGKSCWEKARGNPHRKTYISRPLPSWCRRRMGIVGTSSADHLRSNLAVAAKGPLPADVYEEARRRLGRP